MTYQDSYTPIDPDIYEIFEGLIKDKCPGKIFYFNPENKLDEAAGPIQTILKNVEGKFLVTEGNLKVRLDKVITVFGKPGPAYDEYDRYGNACLTCEDIGQF